MPKKRARKKKAKSETVILIRLPDANARRGTASLTIQRGDLGHMTEFDFNGLTLKNDIAEVVQTALATLNTLEISPSPTVRQGSDSSDSSAPDPSEKPPTKASNAPQIAENPSKTASAGGKTQLSDGLSTTDTDSYSARSERTERTPIPEIKTDNLPTNDQAQLALF